MGHEYWRPGAVDNLPYSASPTVGRTPAGLGLVELTIGATSKGDRAYGFIENNYPEIRPQSRTDTSNEAALLTHPLRIARHKATSFRVEQDMLAFADDVARIIDGEIRYKPQRCTNKKELSQHLCSLLCNRPTPLTIEVVNAQALHGQKRNVAAVDRFQVKFDKFTPLEIEYYLNGISELETQDAETAEQLQLIHKHMEQMFTGILTVQELENMASGKDLQFLKKVIDGILLEDPLFQSKIQKINGKDRRDPEFAGLLRGLFEASLGLPIRLREMISQYHLNASENAELFAFPVRNSAGHIQIDERTLAQSPVIRSQAIGPQGMKLGFFELKGHEEERSIEIQRYFAQPEMSSILWQYLLTLAELTATEKEYSRLTTRASNLESRFLQSQGFVPQGDVHYPHSQNAIRRTETFSKPFNLGTR